MIKKIIEAVLEVVMLSLAFAIAAQVIYDNTTWFEVPGWSMFLISFCFLGIGYIIVGLLPTSEKKQVQE